MNENINLVELLKDCPKGAKLYTPIYGEVEFDNINNGSNFPIITKDKQGTHISFTKKGHFTYIGTPECLLFPSKDQRDWSKYQKPFVNGDIITSKEGGIALFSHTQTRFKCSNVVYYHCLFYPSEIFKLGLDYGIGNVSDCRFATEEEKQKLFQAIKDNGYKWVEKTKTLEKLITPKFKLGDIIQDEDSYKVKITAINEDGFYEYESLITKGIGGILFEEQNNWTLVEYQVGDYGISSYKEIYRINSIIDSHYVNAMRLDNGANYSYPINNLTKINKYPINQFKPFDKVLVRGSNFMTWKAMLFSYYDTMTHKFVTNCDWKQCIPYNTETEHLVGTCLDCPEFYINW